MNYFDKSEIKISVPNLPALVLRAAGQADQDYLRQWKNAHKQYFFHQEEILLNQQLQWYELFQKRPYDLMLIVEYEKQVFGCMGIRLLEDCWEVYNVVLGLKEFGGRGLMGLAFSAMLDFSCALKIIPITLQVLKSNPAVNWYQKQGFCITETRETFFCMAWQGNKL